MYAQNSRSGKVSKFAAMSSLIIISLIIGYIAGLQTEVTVHDDFS